MGNRILKASLVLLCGAGAIALLAGCGSTAVMSSAAPTNQTWSITGTLSPAADSAGATVTLSGSASATAAADSNGNYSFSGLSNSNYIVTPSRSGMRFNPATQSISISGSSRSSVNFSEVKLQSITITPASTTIAKGTSDQFTAIGSFSDGTTQNLTSSASWRAS